MFQSAIATGILRYNYLDTVYNGIDEQQFEFGPGTGNYCIVFRSYTST